MGGKVSRMGYGRNLIESGFDCDPAVNNLVDKVVLI